MSQNNIIVFPAPKRDPKKGQKNTAEKTQGIEEGLIPFPPSKNNWSSDLRTKKATFPTQKPSHNPYKDWYKKQSQDPDNLIDGADRWPSMPAPGKSPQIPRGKPYVFGTGLSFLLLAGALLFGQGHKGLKDREIASAEYYKPPIKITNSAGHTHHVTLYKNENGRLSVSLVLEEDFEDRDLDSVSKRRPNNVHNKSMKNLKQVWREQEQKTLYLIKTGQRKLISIGRKPH